MKEWEHQVTFCPVSMPDITFRCVHYVPVMPSDEGILNVTLVIGDELANQGFTAITYQGKHIFIYLYS